MSSPILDLEQMKQQYHDEWLLIAYTDIDENLVTTQRFGSEKQERRWIIEQVHQINDVPVSGEWLNIQKYATFRRHHKF